MPWGSPDDLDRHDQPARPIPLRSAWLPGLPLTGFLLAHSRRFAMVRLIPRDEKFFDLFVADGENLLEAARKLEAMVGSYDRLDERVAEIQALEKQGDQIDDEIAVRLERSFITPFDREDIHELAVHLDDVLDGIQASAETFVIYGIARPDEDARQMVGIISAQAVQLLEALNKLERGKGLTTHLAIVHDLEHQADGLSRAAIGRLFRDGRDPLEVIKLRDLYRELEETIDAAEDAAEVIERILAKS
jgi:predicted phosphate transport protein (TIGR00153 family)